MISLYPGCFSGLCLRQAALKDEGMSPSETEQLAYCLLWKQQVLESQCFAPLHTQVYMLCAVSNRVSFLCSKSRVLSESTPKTIIDLNE